MAFASLAQAAWAKDIATRQVLVEWRDGWVEVFVNMPTKDLMRGGTAVRAGLIGADQRIAFATLRDDPSYILEELLGELALSADGPAFEPMSMMAHGQFERLAFGTPFDAAMAASVCGVPADVERLPPERTQVYLGGIRDVAATDQTLQLNLAALEGPVKLTVFSDGSMVQTGFVDTQNGPVTIERDGAVILSGMASIALWITLAAAGIIAGLAGLRFRPARTA